MPGGDPSADAARDQGPDSIADARPRRSGAAATDRAARGSAPARSRGDAADPPAAGFAQLLAAGPAEDRRAAPVGAGPDRPALATSPTVATAERPLDAAPRSEASAPAPTLPVPIDAPDFPAALGVQVSVFARDGVQHAELHLNPAETGPVSIEITLDGTQARVEFGADLAATRRAIENGLPELASALRDAGFTLAGGGVAQHSRSGGGHAGDDPADRGGQRPGDARRGEAEGAATARATLRVAAGGIDVYA